MHPDRDFQSDGPLSINADDIINDLELGVLLEAMSNGDDVVHSVSLAALLSDAISADEIRYRQEVLQDWLRLPDVLRGLYVLAGEAITAERQVARGFFSDRLEPLLHRSRRVLELFVERLRQLRRVAEEHAVDARSPGVTRFFRSVMEQLGDDYLATVERHLKELAFRDGLLMSARLGDGNQGVGYVLRTGRDENKGLFRHLAVKKPSYGFTIPERDEAGARALSALRDRGLNLVANAAAQSAEHVLNFFVALRRELAFYVGCVQLHERLVALSAPVSYPVPHEPGARCLTARGLVDPCLALSLEGEVVGNDLDADGARAVFLTGANRGGKSTFLRALGLAQLMMQCGMYVTADSLSASMCRALFTHYAREEDTTMTSGKLDEELRRMSGIADHVSAGAILLCNESFAATNEREGSDIAAGVVQAMLDGGVRVFFVTHLYDLAHGFYQRGRDSIVFMRAERGEDGVRPFHLRPAEPLPTSYGADVFTQVFDTEHRPATAPGTLPGSDAEGSDSSGSSVL